MILTAVTLCARLAAAAAGPTLAPASANPWLTWLERGDATLARTDGYSVLYHKKEWVSRRVQTDDVMRLKFMKPFDVYLEWVNPSGNGGEAIYIQGWNKNRVHTHPGGFWGILTFNLAPESHWIMRGNRHTIDNLGLGRLNELVGANVRRAVAAGEFEGIDHGPSTMFGRKAEVLEAVLPIDPAKGYYCRRTIAHFDAENGIILNIRNYDCAGALVEEYGYEDFRPDLLTAADFDPANPHYRF